MFETKFESIIELLDVFRTERDCVEYLEWLLWDNNMPLSPFIESSKVYKCSNGKYKCSSSNRYFNLRTGTIFEDSKIPLRKWFVAIYILVSHKRAYPPYNCQRMLDITQKTAWFMLQRLRKAMFPNKDKLGGFGGTVEIDESFFGGALPNKKKNRFLENRKGKAQVLGMAERGGQVRATVAKDTLRGDDILGLVTDNIVKESNLYADSSRLYHQFEGDRDYNYERVLHGAKEYVRGDVHTNTLEGFWSIMQRGIYGVYHFVSKKHLESYVNEFTFRYNTRKYGQSERFDLMLCKVPCGRLRYSELVK